MSNKPKIDPSNPMVIPKYVDKLPIPKVIQPKSKDKDAAFYEVEMKEFKQRLHRDFPSTKVWGYEGVYPGPTFEVKTNECVKVKWFNNLPVKDHLLPVDKTVHGAEPSNPEVRTVVHLHGANVSPESDGYPEAWFTNGFEQTGPFFKQKVYDYPNPQQAATLWYHDHALGITRLNVYAGLAGFYLIRDAFEEKLNLPSGQYEVPLVIQDRSFNNDGSLFYPSQPENLPPDAELPNPSIVPEFFGNTILVNGKVWPFLEVEPRKYRFRFLNGSNSRFYRMRLSSGQSFFQIGTDGGLLEKPAQAEEIILAPGERADVVIDFSKFKKEYILLTNDANSPFPDGDSVDENTTGQIMQFRVTLPLSGKDKSTLPDFLRPVKKISEKSAQKTRDLTLDEQTDEFGRLMLLLTGKEWDDPISEKPELGSIEIWRLINLTPDTHPIHLHLVQFQILDRQPFNVDHYTASGEIEFTGPAQKPAPNERGWKDTVQANPGEITRIIARFCSFAGIFPWHCHILEHEDHEMMRPYKVVDRGGYCPEIPKTNFVKESLRQNLFWLRIMQEHALFIRQGLPCDEKELIDEAKALEKMFKALLARAQNTPKELCPVAALNKDVIKALEKIIAFKSVVLKHLITCKLGGSNLPLLIDHIRREAIRFRVILIRLQNGIDILPAEEALQEEVFWLRIMGEHARFIAHLLDPSERRLVCKSRDFGKRFERLRLKARDLESMMVPQSFENWLLPEELCRKKHSSCCGKLPEAFVIPRLKRFNQEVRSATEDIKDFKKTALQLVEDCTVLSIISPLLADHVLREARMALEDLRIIHSKL